MHAYLQQLYTAHALFQYLVESAIDMHPEQLGDNLVVLEYVATQRELGKALGVSPTTIGRELKRLENHHWILRSKSHISLGSMNATGIYIHADMAAKSSTGEDRLVSGQLFPKTMRTKAQTTKEEGARGAGRTWVG